MYFIEYFMGLVAAYRFGNSSYLYALQKKMPTTD